jgi:hypothetical protein
MGSLLLCQIPILFQWTSLALVDLFNLKSFFCWARDLFASAGHGGAEEKFFCLIVIHVGFCS